jgi:hypothetical protein
MREVERRLSMNRWAGRQGVDGPTVEQSTLFPDCPLAEHYQLVSGRQVM